MTVTPYQPDPAATPARVTSALAVAALILSVVPLVVPLNGFVPNIGFEAIAVVLSVVFGIIALRRIKAREQNGRALAMAGLVISWTWIAYAAMEIAVYALDLYRGHPELFFTAPGL
jgi:Domain of unknown function (DUF4190)